MCVEWQNRTVQYQGKENPGTLQFLQRSVTAQPTASRCSWTHTITQQTAKKKKITIIYLFFIKKKQ